MNALIPLWITLCITIVIELPWGSCGRTKYKSPRRRDVHNHHDGVQFAVGSTFQLEDLLELTKGTDADNGYVKQNSSVRVKTRTGKMFGPGNTVVNCYYCNIFTGNPPGSGAGGGGGGWSGGGGGWGRPKAKQRCGAEGDKCTKFGESEECCSGLCGYQFTCTADVPSLSSGEVNKYQKGCSLYKIGHSCRRDDDCCSGYCGDGYKCADANSGQQDPQACIHLGDACANTDICCDIDALCHAGKCLRRRNSGNGQRRPFEK